MNRAEEDALYEAFDNDRHAVIGTRGAFLVAIRAAVAQERERAAKKCEERAHMRFAESGIREPDTGASYYPKSIEVEYVARDEEDEECAAAIRAEMEKIK